MEGQMGMGPERTLGGWPDLTARRSGDPFPLTGSSMPIWRSETLTPPVSGHWKSGRGTPLGAKGEVEERGCVSMARLARIFAVLSALATVLLVAGAQTKY